MGFMRPALSRNRVALIAIGLCVAAALTATTVVLSLGGPAAPARARQIPDAPAPRLHVSGNRLVDASGAPIVLHGVDRSSGEFGCVQNLGIWVGPVNQASVTAMRQWHINAVRLPLNEACWNGQSYVNIRYRGARYRSAVKAYVNLLNRNGIVAILDLHWTDGAYHGPAAKCRSARAQCQKPMPDAAQSVPFWRSVARTFKGNDAVVFDLFNEPFPERARGADESEAWRCWLRGGQCTGISYPVAGMQTLVNTVRATGARNVIMLGGIDFAGDLTEWLRYEPHDPDHNLAASWHSYNFSGCNTESCWNRQVAPVINRVPLIAGEIGEKDCADDYIDPLMTWLDARSASYLAWAWNADFGCGAGPGLIKSYAGTPTGFGAGYRAHLLSLK